VDRKPIRKRLQDRPLAAVGETMAHAASPSVGLCEHREPHRQDFRVGAAVTMILSKGAWSGQQCIVPRAQTLHPDE
jgi:hypothetical protein